MTPEPVNVADYERLAADRLPEGPLGYYAGGAGDERTLRENVAAYARHAPAPARAGGRQRGLDGHDGARAPRSRCR